MKKRYKQTGIFLVLTFLVTILFSFNWDYSSDIWLAVKEFQGKQENMVTMGNSIESRPGPVRAVFGAVNRNDNVELIARLIHAEARAEPYEGQVAVGAVLLNRVESPSFPNSVSGVIYQPLAFESVANGQFNLPPTSENRRAARAAVNGWDPSYGSLFFWNPSKPVNRWIWSRKTVRTIGDHVFAH